MRVSLGYVTKVVQFYEESNLSVTGPRKTPVRNKMSADVVEYVESEKLCQPSMYTSELQQRLLLDGISPLGHMPSRSAIKKVPTGRLQNDKEKGVPSTQRIVVSSNYGIHRLFP